MQLTRDLIAIAKFNCWLKIHQKQFGGRTRWGSLSTPPEPLAAIWGLYFKGEGKRGERKEGSGKGRREGRGKGGRRGGEKKGGKRKGKEGRAASSFYWSWLRPWLVLMEAYKGLCGTKGARGRITKFTGKIQLGAICVSYSGFYDSPVDHTPHALTYQPTYLLIFMYRTTGTPTAAAQSAPGQNSVYLWFSRNFVFVSWWFFKKLQLAQWTLESIDRKRLRLSGELHGNWPGIWNCRYNIAVRDSGGWGHGIRCFIVNQRLAFSFLFSLSLSTGCDQKNVPRQKLRFLKNRSVNLHVIFTHCKDFKERMYIFWQHVKLLRLNIQ